MDKGLIEWHQQLSGGFLFCLFDIMFTCCGVVKISIGSESKLKQVSTNSMVSQDWNCFLSVSTEILVCSWMSLSQWKCQWISCMKFNISSFVESVRSIHSWQLMLQIHCLKPSFYPVLITVILYQLAFLNTNLQSFYAYRIVLPAFPS